MMILRKDFALMAIIGLWVLLDFLASLFMMPYKDFRPTIYEG